MSEPLTIRVHDADLSWIRVDHQTRLQFGESEIVIETPFLLTTASGAWQLDPEDRAGLGPLLALYPDTLTAAIALPDGSLRLELRSGAVLTVPPDPKFEAWQVGSPLGLLLVVCTPGGALAIWQ